MRPARTNRDGGGGPDRTEVCCRERLVTPVLVVFLHVSLVADIMWHRPDLLYPEDAWDKGVWLLVAVTLTSYLQASTTDPGWLRPKGMSFTWPGACMLCPCAVVVALCPWLWVPCRRRGLSGSSSHRELQDLVREGDRKLSPMVGAEVYDVEAAPPSPPGPIDVEGIQKRRAGLSTFGEEAILIGAPSSSPNSPRLAASGAAAEATSSKLDAEVAVNGEQRRWCKRCEIYQPLRTKHCHECAMCVRTHDHHCPWIGTCVGENNRLIFYWFLVLQSVELAIFFFEGLQGISIMDPSIWLIIGLLLIAVFFMMVICLLCFHSFLLLANLTTWEHVSWPRISYLKHLPMDRGSPFARSMTSNVAAYCCGPRWCSDRWRRFAGLRYEEDGGILWEVAEPRPPNCLLRCCADVCGG